MKLFSKINLYLFVLISLTLNLSADKIRGEYATKNLKGQDYYLVNCSSCHGEGNRGGNIASIREWKSFFAKDASELIYFHEEDDSTIKVIEYLKGNEFKEQSKLMLEFLQEFAYDSEHIPTCN
jgi:hypothetical protein